MQNQFLKLSRPLTFLAVLMLGTAAHSWSEVRQSFTLVVEGEEFAVTNTPSYMEFEYILSTPFVELRGYDYTPEVDQCRGLVEIPWDRTITLDDFPRFAFFDESPSTVGILRGFSGNAASSITLTFIDLNTGKSLDVPVNSMEGPNWIMDGDRPIGWREVRFDSMGSHALSLGYAPRLHKCWIFTDEGCVRDTELERRHFEQQFQVIELSADDWRELQKPLSDIDREAAERLLDAVYCGHRLGRRDEVMELLSRAGEAIREEMYALIAGWE